MPYRKSSSRAGTSAGHPAPDANLDAALWPDPPDQQVTADPNDPGDTQVLAELDPDEEAPDTDPDDTTTRPFPAADGPRRAARDRLRIQQKQEARRRRIRLSAGAAAVLALAGGVTAVLTTTTHHARPASAPHRPAPTGYTGPYAPVVLNADNSVTMAWPGVNAPVLDVYEDFTCAACRSFELTDGALLQQLAYQRKLRIVYFPFTAYASQPQQAASIRAWAAARCVPPGHWARYHEMLYSNQPPQTAATGYPTAQLIQLGRDAGITSPAFTGCVQSQQYAELDAPLSDQIINTGLPTMPALILDGKSLGNNLTPAALRHLVLTAHSAKPPAPRARHTAKG